MKRSKFTDEQVAYALRQVESGIPSPVPRPAPHARDTSGVKASAPGRSWEDSGTHTSEYHLSLCQPQH